MGTIKPAVSITHSKKHLNATPVLEVSAMPHDAYLGRGNSQARQLDI